MHADSHNEVPAMINEELRYPVGKFTLPNEWDASATHQWRHDIAELPVRVRPAVERLGDVQLDTPYREGGWTVRQTVHHLADSHLNAYCRFRLALTEDSPTIKTYNEAVWAELPDARSLPLAPSLEILDGVHHRLAALFDSLTPELWARTFVHPDRGRTVSVAQNAALYAWHGRHHVAHITSLRRRQGW